MGKLRVAAYCRVSTNRYEQKESLSTMVTHYTNYINSNSDWHNAGIYVDDAKSGKRRNIRKDYLRLMDDCRAGKIDKIICKGIRRFSRNTVDCLEDVRELTKLGVTVYFENENFDTGTMRSELILSVVVSVAENELTNIAQNIKWSHKRKYMEGKCIINSNLFLGYDNVDGVLKINEGEAEIIRLIFLLYDEGYGTRVIAEKINDMGYRTVYGKTFGEGSVTYILKNEKYCGRLILQKYITDINGNTKKNDGSLADIYDWGIAHEPIVSQELFDRVQERLLSQKEKYKTKRDYITGSSPFSGVMVCGKCGKPYIRAVHNSENGKYATEHMACSTYKKLNKALCGNKPIKTKTLEQLFVRAHNKALNADMTANLSTSSDSEIGKVDTELQRLLGIEKQYILMQTRGINSPEMQSDYDKLIEDINDLELQKRQAERMYAEEIQKQNKLAQMQKYLTKADKLQAFDAGLFRLMISEIRVIDRENLIFVLINGIEISVSYEYQRYNDII